MKPFGIFLVRDLARDLVHALAALNFLPRTLAKAQPASAVNALGFGCEVCLTTARARLRKNTLGLIRGFFRFMLTLRVFN